MPAIPASQIVSVIPSVLGAGGSALDMNGLILTTNARVPIGMVLEFATAADVGTFFGSGSDEKSAADIYFAGFDNSFVKPGNLLMAQYNQVDVAAYMRGGNISSMALGDLQALTGTLNLVVDGYTFTGGTITLAAASSFSSAASIIQTALNSADPTEASVTGSISTNTATASITGSVMTVSAILTGILVPGQTLTGSGVTSGTKIVSQLTGSQGSTGTYLLNKSQTVGSETITASGGCLTVTVVASGTLAVGQTVTGSGVTAGTIITALDTGTGGTGKYAVNISQTVASEALTAVATIPTVAYDSTSGAFTITSGITGVPSTMAYATGTLAASIALTLASGAILSQGAAAATPAGAMDAIVAETQNWAQFMTLFDPDGGSGNTVKLAFAAWVNAQDDAYGYMAWDTDVTPKASSAATGSMGYILGQSNSSGTVCISTANFRLAAFALGYPASLDFTRTNGRTTMAFRSQTGFTPDITSATVAENLIANGYNFYGKYATRNQNFEFFQPGSVSGPFKWADTYFDEIWLNNSFQLGMMEGLMNTPSVPYNDAGNDLIRSFCADTITQGGNFGIFRQGVQLSAAQIAEVNNQAGVPIDKTLSTQGYYLQIKTALPITRAARGSPPMTFWYMDGGSVQKLNLASVEVQ